MILVLLICCDISTPISIECEFDVASYDTPLNEVYRCYAKRMSFPSNESVTEIIGNHMPGKSNDDVRLIDIRRISCKEIPKKIETQFTKLEGVWGSHCGIEKLNINDLKPFANLKHLNLDYNLIRNLTKDVFSENSNLSKIELSNNELRYIEEGTFRGKQLKEVNLRHNPCINFKANVPNNSVTLRTFIVNDCVNVKDLRYKLKNVEQQKSSIEKILESKKNENKVLINNGKKQAKAIESLNQTLINLAAENINQATQIKELSDKIKKLEKELTDHHLTVEKQRSRIVIQADTCQSEKEKLSEKNRECQDLNQKNLFDYKKEIKKFENEFNSVAVGIGSCTRTIELECIFESWSSYTCNIENLNLLWPNVTINEVYGEHEKAKKAKDVRELRMWHQTVINLPLGIGNFFRHLKKFSIQNSDLKAINKEAFQKMDSLKVLDMTFNELTIIEKEQFVHLKNLETLLLNDNKFIQIQTGAFSKNPSLKNIELSNNDLKLIYESSFGLPNLTHVNLQNSKCVNMSYPEASLEELKEHLAVFCSEPLQIKCEFAVRAFGDFQCLVKDLNVITQRRLATSLTGSLNKEYETRAVEVLTVHNQTMQIIPLSMATLFPKLINLVIKNSKLKTISSKHLEGLTFLKILDLSINSISGILKDDLFVGIPSIEEINLSRNKISALEENILEKLKSLKKLDLSYNLLILLDSNIFGSGNDQKFLELNFSKNKLKGIDVRMLNIGSMKYAEIDFSFNDCTGKTALKHFGSKLTNHYEILFEAFKKNVTQKCKMNN